MFNQGNVDATNVEVTDYIPAGLTLNDAAWTQSGSVATRVIASIAEGQVIPLEITFTVDADAPASISNFAEISEDNGDDCDSTADSDATNDGTPVDNAIGTGCEVGGDEDDHDIETIIIPTDPAVYDLALRKTLLTNPANITA